MLCVFDRLYASEDAHVGASACMCQCLRMHLYVCALSKRHSEMNEVCVMACCSAMFIRLQHMCLCISERVCVRKCVCFAYTQIP